jgi:tetratricopeptide (TPR) repeat protein/O-antigen ligase
MNRASELRDFSFRSGSGSWTWEQALLWCCDAGLAGVVFIAPLFMGGRHPVGKLVYVVFACLAAGAYCLRQCLLPEARWRRSGAEWLILAVVVLLMVQITPLSPGLLKQFSPGLVKLLPLWQDGGDSPAVMGAWRTVSVTPRETRAGLVIFLAHVLVFLTVVQRISTRNDVERLLRWLAAAASGMAALALAQYFCGNGRFLWIYMHPARDTFSAAKGSFENQNHLAQFLAMGLGPLIWLAWRRFESLQAVSPSRRPKEFNWRAQAPSVLIMAALTAVGVAGLLAFSRGGVIALFTAAALCVFLYAWKKLLGVRSLAALGAVGVAASLAILAYGYDPLVREIGSLQDSQSIEELSEARAKLWSAMLQASRNHLVLGAGVGSHVHVYPTYLEEFYNKKFTHGENGYLQVLLETGIAGCVLLGLGIGLAVFWSARVLWRGDPANVACAAPLVAGLAASLVQSLGDFVWYIPACMSLAVILLACICRLHQISGEVDDEAAEAHEAVIPRITWLGATVLLLSLSAAMFRDRAPPALAAPHWDNYRGLWLRSTGQSVWSSQEEQIERTNPALIARIIEHLEAVVRRDPDDAEANFRLAYFYQKMFDLRQQTADNAMDLMQIRDAALSSGFSSRKQQDQWLAAAIGENRSYLDQAAWRLRRSLRLCPLQGEAYVCLAKTSFLDGLGQEAQSAYVKQAELLRPFEGAVLVAIGKEAIVAGDPQRAVNAWKQAFHCNPESQQTVVDLLAGRAPAMDVVNDLEPDLRGMARLFVRYRALNRLDDAKFVAGRYAPMLEDEANRLQGAAAARPWFSASIVYLFLEDPERALACIEQAVRAAPGEANYRRAYAFRLLEAGRYDDAIKQFQWRLRRDPNDESAKAGLARAMRRGLTTPPVAQKPKAGGRR